MLLVWNQRYFWTGLRPVNSQYGNYVRLLPLVNLIWIWIALPNKGAARGPVLGGDLSNVGQNNLFVNQFFFHLQSHQVIYSWCNCHSQRINPYWTHIPQSHKFPLHRGSIDPQTGYNPERLRVIHHWWWWMKSRIKAGCSKDLVVTETQTFEVLCGSSGAESPIQVLALVPQGSKLCQRKACLAAVDHDNFLKWRNGPCHGSLRG